MKRRDFLKVGLAAGVGVVLPKNLLTQPLRQQGGTEVDQNQFKSRITTGDRRQAARNMRAKGLRPGAAAGEVASLQDANADPIPHYFGPYPNYANSPLPKGPIDTITVDAGGSGYSNAPVVTIFDVYGLGTGATAHAVVVAGAITDIVIDTPGTNYCAPLVDIVDPTGVDAFASASLGAGVTGGLRKFQDRLPKLGALAAGDAGKYLEDYYIPTATPDPTVYPGPTPGSQSDYYEIALVDFEHRFHSDLPFTRVRGYVQLETATNHGEHVQLFYYGTTNPIRDINGQPVFGMTKPRYLGPIIVANRDRPVRVKFTNYLAPGSGGDLFIPVDETIMGAGAGPNAGEKYLQSRATIHNHGALVPWISDGTPHQWTIPVGATSAYPKGVSVQDVPDMAPSGQGSLTFYYNNQQSARLLFYHDHAWGTTRLNVYVGEVSGYLLSDQVEQDLIGNTNVSGVKPSGVTGPVVPGGLGIPLIIQDKTFVDADTIPWQDPLWRWNLNTNGSPKTGALWVPSVYMPAQNPWDLSGASAFGRWMYGPWFWPPTTGIDFGPVPNEYYDPVNAPWEPPMRPQMPFPSMGMEAFNDTPMVNGIAYPFVEVDPVPTRFRILNGANDRFLNLSFFIADPDALSVDGRANTEVKMVPALLQPGYPATWSNDGRAGGVPDPFTAGPSWIQIGTEGGFLPEPVVIPPHPVNWNGNPTAFNFGNVSDHALLLGNAERADVIVDFTGYAGQTLILYNDAPTAFPALDPRYDYYTGNPPQMDTGGTPPTLPGFGPNTRTIMQVRVRSNNSGGAAVASVQVLAGGSDYQFAPDVVFTGGGGSGAAATASCSIERVTVLRGGTGYTSAPTVTINGDGTGATAVAKVANGRVTSITLTSKGQGYTAAPTIDITGGGGSGATAVAALFVTAVNLSLGGEGSGYSAAPQVSFVGGGGYGASAVARLVQTGSPFDLNLLMQTWAKTATKPGVFESSQEKIIFPQAPYSSAYNENFAGDASTYVLQHEFIEKFVTGPVTGLKLLTGGTGYTTPPTVNFSGGFGSGAVATTQLTGASVSLITVTNGGSGYTSNPTVTITGGTGTGATAVPVRTRIVQSITVTNGGSGYTSAPTVTISGGGGKNATAVAVVSGGRVTAVNVTNPGKYFTSTPTVSFSGGNGSGAAATANMTLIVFDITITNGGTGYAVSPAPTVTITGGGGSGATAVATVQTGVVTGITLVNGGQGYREIPTVTLTGGGGSGATAVAEGLILPIQPKAIHDEMGAAYDVEYGRMGGLLGVELPKVNSLNQNVVLLPYASPPNDVIKDSVGKIGTLSDGTEIWKLTHNGVDTHPIHFHLVNVQLVNRVAWDGALLPPDPNELGWKETVRVNPLEHTIVAMRPVAPTQPFDIRNSVRPINPAMPVGATLVGGPNGYQDIAGTGVTVTNHMVNFGWEYVWHCHILSHEEMDMMHAIAFAKAPRAPSIVSAVYTAVIPRYVTLTWTDNALNEMYFTVQRAPAATGPWTTLVTNIPSSPASGGTVSYRDYTVVKNSTYFYRVTATNVVGDTTNYGAGTVGYPTATVESLPSNPGIQITCSVNGAGGTPVIFQSGFDGNLAGWAGMIGNVQAVEQASLIQAIGAKGMAATVGGDGLQLANGRPVPAYVFDNSPAGESAYGAGFLFHPNGTKSGEEPIDIFVGLDQDGQLAFGIQYQSADDGTTAQQMRGWVMRDGEQAFTRWYEISNEAHYVEMAWLANGQGSFNLNVDDQAVGTITGNLSQAKLGMVMLGPSMGLSASTSGTLFFDEFVSNKVEAVESSTYRLFIPGVRK